MKMKRCSKCYTIIRKEAKFCGQDGAPLEEIDGESEEIIRFAIDILQKKSTTGRGFAEDMRAAQELLDEAIKKHQELERDFGMDVQPELALP